MKKKSLKPLTICVVTLMILALFSCKGKNGLTGADGEDGRSYIAITWVSGPLYYADDNPATPGTFFNGLYYGTNLGTYAYSYQAWDGSVWAGYYRITINEGESGESGEEGGWFWQDGDDGKDGVDGQDKCFELSCLSIGPSFYTWPCYFSKITAKMESEMEKIQNAGIEIDDVSPSLRKEATDLESFLNSTSELEMTKEEGRIGIYRFEHYYIQMK